MARAKVLSLTCSSSIEEASVVAEEESRGRGWEVTVERGRGRGLCFTSERDWSQP